MAKSSAYPYLYYSDTDYERAPTYLSEPAAAAAVSHLEASAVSVVLPDFQIAVLPDYLIAVDPGFPVGFGLAYPYIVFKGYAYSVPYFLFTWLPEYNPKWAIY